MDDVIEETQPYEPYDLSGYFEKIEEQSRIWWDGLEAAQTEED